MAINGPKVQYPSGPFVQEDREPSIEAAAFMRALQAVSFNGTRSGTTGERPTSDSFRWRGMPYFDTTLGLPIFLNQASSNAWVKADGTPA